MAELRRAEKLASAKKRLKQFQQKNRDGQSESGRSTPSKKKLEGEDGVMRALQSENGGSTCSLSHSENLSSNISGTESPVPTLDHNLENLSQILNGNSQPDFLNVSNVVNDLPKVSENLFQTQSPNSFFVETTSPMSSQSGSDFFDNFSSGSGPPNEVFGGAARPMMMNRAFSHHSTNEIKASTPEGPPFQDTPNYSFPDSSFSPIQEIKSNVPEETATKDLEEKLKDSCARNAELEQQINEQKTQIVQLQTHLEDMKKKADEGVSTLKHHVQAIEILVSEKTELQNTLEKRQEEIQCKTGELEELQSRLRASRHRVSDLERELGSLRSQLQSLNSSHTDLSTHHASLLTQMDSLGKRCGDLELEVSDLQSKLEARDCGLSELRVEMEEKTSQLSLAQVRIQQLNSVPGENGGLEEELHRKTEELRRSVSSLESQLEAVRTGNDESVKEYQRYVNRLNTELQDLKNELEMSNEVGRQSAVREQQLIQQLSELERQLQVNRNPVSSSEDPTLAEVREQLRLAEQSCHTLQAQLQEKSNEMEFLREGLQERALRIQELEVTVDRLETERPDTANLQAAIESDKVAASRAVAQNGKLKKQLEELQEALVKLSNNKLELTQQLQHEQHNSRDLTEKLDRIQESKIEEMEKAQQTEHPMLKENEAQTIYSHSVVSPEAMSKLEEKFRKTMGELADLSDEKQRLEHLVLQLQGETETIGEYITLYQIQRGMLRQRAQEKDEQVAKLAQDKEALRNKLAQLNCLVQRLVRSGVGHTPGQVNGYDSEKSLEVKENSNPVELAATHNPTNIETAEQIQSLLSEIGSHNLVTSSTAEHPNINFHPCPWCSGRLITV